MTYLYGMKIRIIVPLAFALIACRQEPKSAGFASVRQPDCSIDSAAVAWFFARHPNLLEHRGDVHDFYREKKSCVWFSQNGLNEQAHVLYSRLLSLDQEGLPADFPYQAELERIMVRNTAEVNSDILLSTLYFYYTCQIYGDVDHDRAVATGWFIPREKSVYRTHVDSVLNDRGKRIFFPQYYNLRLALKKYRAIEKRGGWETIEMPSTVKAYVVGDSAQTIVKVRKRLEAEGIASGEASNLFDQALADAITEYLRINQRSQQPVINTNLLRLLNVPVSQRIRTIMLNMERCRWISPRMAQSPQYIGVNIPSYSLVYFQDSKPVLTSKVVVGKELNKTVVFSGEISYLAFSPYWNVPESILKNEILPAIQKDPRYLQKHNMQWHDKRVRQLPGPNNSLGLVKFMFPNSNNIYLHDTPAKSLFAKEERALSHGCVRVEKARELAIAITANDAGWTSEMVDEAMNRGSENYHVLKKKIPVYIAYFTAWADSEGNTAFFDDVYKRDPELASLLFKPAPN